MTKGREFTQLKEEERIKIEVLLQKGFSLSSIGRALNRPVSTISREVKRNGPRKYTAVRAQTFTQFRHRHKRKHTVFDQDMRDYIKHCLCKFKWSPEIISVMGRKQREDFISGERIYQWIWDKKFSMAKEDQLYQQLYKHLKHARRRRKRGRKRNMRGNILERRFIEHRPSEANERERQGDLEADIILGKDRKPGLLVALDRKTRKAWIRKLNNKNAGYVMTKVARICSLIGGVKTVTFDNDQSFAEHYRLKEMGIDTFFTSPYRSQEKGSVENRIGIIRRFFSKKTDFEYVDEKQVSLVQQLINDRPMRMFKYQSPNQIHNPDPIKLKKRTFAFIN
jgi:transposase, IS30 family